MFLSLPTVTSSRFILDINLPCDTAAFTTCTNIHSLVKNAKTVYTSLFPAHQKAHPDKPLWSNNNILWLSFTGALQGNLKKRYYLSVLEVWKSFVFSPVPRNGHIVNAALLPGHLNARFEHTTETESNCVIVTHHADSTHFNHCSKERRCIQSLHDITDTYLSLALITLCIEHIKHTYVISSMNKYNAF